MTNTKDKRGKKAGFIMGFVVPLIFGIAGGDLWNNGHQGFMIGVVFTTLMIIAIRQAIELSY